MTASRLTVSGGLSPRAGAVPGSGCLPPSPEATILILKKQHPKSAICRQYVYEKVVIVAKRVDAHAY
jgi:hypothetical protein